MYLAACLPSPTIYCTEKCLHFSRKSFSNFKEPWSYASDAPLLTRCGSGDATSSRVWTFRTTLVRYVLLSFISRSSAVPARWFRASSIPSFVEHIREDSSSAMERRKVRNVRREAVSMPHESHELIENLLSDNTETMCQSGEDADVSLLRGQWWMIDVTRHFEQAVADYISVNFAASFPKNQFEVLVPTVPVTLQSKKSGALSAAGSRLCAGIVLIRCNMGLEVLDFMKRIPHVYGIQAQNSKMSLSIPAPELMCDVEELLVGDCQDKKKKLEEFQISAAASACVRGAMVELHSEPAKFVEQSEFGTLRISGGRVYGSSDANGVPFFSRKSPDLFAEEAIGAEHGEGFSVYRPRGPLHVDVDYLNDRMQERGLQRIRYAMKPDEAFGLIYSWDNVIADTRALRIDAWNRLAAEEGKVISNDPEKHRLMLSMSANRVMEQVLNWGETGSNVEQLTQRLAELYCESLARVHAPMDGVQQWLEALDTAGVPCAVASSLDRVTLLAALERMGLRKYFQAIVTEEDGMDSIAHRFLSAAVKLDRPPFKCVVFEDDPRSITAAHNCTMKAVALIGSHPAYELTQADLAVSSFTELSVINLRRLFANKGTEFMDLQKQPEEKKPPKRKLTNDTLF